MGEGFPPPGQEFAVHCDGESCWDKMVDVSVLTDPKSGGQDEQHTQLRLRPGTLRGKESRRGQRRDLPASRLPVLDLGSHHI